MTKVLLHEAVRPHGNRDDAGTIGESLHALADNIQTNAPELKISVNITSKPNKQYWQAVEGGLRKIRSLSSETFGPAVNRIIELAKTD